MARFASRGVGRTSAPRLAVLVAVLTLIPTLTMLVMAGRTAQERWDEHHATHEVQIDSTRVRELAALQAAVTDEVIASGAVVASDVYGLAPSETRRILGFVPTVEMEAARAIVDAQPPAVDAALLRDLDALGRLRRAIDAELSSLDRLTAFQQAFRRHTATALGEALVRLEAHAAAAGGGRERIDQTVGATRLLLLAFREAGDRIGFVNRILTTGGTPGERKGLVEANARFQLAMGGAAPLLGPSAAAAADRLQSAPSTDRFDAVVTEVGGSGEPAPEPLAAVDPAAYGRALRDGAAWLAGLSTVLEESTEDVWLAADRQERAATVALQEVAVTVAVVLVLVAITTVGIARSMVRAARRLEATARRIASGDFHAPVSSASATGPREMQAVGVAMGDLTDTLTALEAYVTHLADDPGSAALDRPLPGATGRALQVTVDRLREEMRLDEQTRAGLADLAAHDALTGLLNRGAALTALDHELDEDRRSRGDDVVALFFMDLDGLKDINDTHGHAAGDAAIRLTADALRRATRRGDIVARLGGDEFVVAMRAQEVATVDIVAARIQDALARAPLTVGSATVPLRCSIGVALWAPGETADDLLRRADVALYRAKGSGRNRVVWHDPPEQVSAERAEPQPSSTS